MANPKTPAAETPAEPEIVVSTTTETQSVVEDFTSVAVIDVYAKPTAVETVDTGNGTIVETYI